MVPRVPVAETPRMPSALPDVSAPVAVEDDTPVRGATIEGADGG